MCTLWPSRRQDISIPGSSVSPAGRAARASWWPATVSWSVSAITSSPAAWACRTTSAGGSVPSDAVLWLCRSARPLATLAGKPRRRRTERQVQVLARVAQVSELQRLDQQQSRRSRPPHPPKPRAPPHARGGPAAWIRRGGGDGAPAGAGAPAPRAGEPGDEPAKRQRPRQPDRDL